MKPKRSRRRSDDDRADATRDTDAPTEDVSVSWDQPQSRYPAPERPRDLAEERKRGA
jgi:hypothetical protein